MAASSSPWGQVHRLSELLDDMVEAVNSPLVHLTSLKHWQDGCLITLFQKVEQPESQCLYPTSPSPWGLRTWRGRAHGTQHISTGMFSREEEQIHETKTVISFLTAARRYSVGLRMGSMSFLHCFWLSEVNDKNSLKVSNQKCIWVD